MTDTPTDNDAIEAGKRAAEAFRVLDETAAIAMAKLRAVERNVDAARREAKAQQGTEAGEG